MISTVVGDCREVMATMDPDSFDAIVTDPPSGIHFMGRDWDHDRGGRQQWIAWMTEVMRECYRVLKPGGHAVVWALPRTSHWTATAIEDAGFDVRDIVMHLFGSGFPKSLAIDKAIDKAAPRVNMFAGFAAHFAERRIEMGLTQKQIAGYFPSKSGGLTGCVWNWENSANVPTVKQWATLQPILGLSQEWLPLIERVEAEREVVGQDTKARSTAGHSALPALGANVAYHTWNITAPATDAAREWAGWGTALKPAAEHWILARKPLSEGTVAANVLKHRTAGLNIDGCRINSPPMKNDGWRPNSSGNSYVDSSAIFGGGRGIGLGDVDGNKPYNGDRHPAGRWPANLVLDEDAAIALDEMSGERPTHPGIYTNGSKGKNGWGMNTRIGQVTSMGDTGGASRFFYCAKSSRSERGQGNSHPTVKPVALMRWLCRLVTPPSGTILDPFVGSGSTLVAALIEGFSATGIDQNPDYIAIAQNRINGIQMGLVA